ncbi:hypothetical protein ABZ413_33745 [Nocardia rhamnosiphila]|uniref:hypothetical protein n=1 Tax=Nocardia rhamnosiphila TaxID=426716 RepID=UPI0033E494F5
MTAAPIHLHAHDHEPGHPRRLDPRTITAPAVENRAPVRTTPLPTTGRFPPLFAVMGAHGGAATSTLARWWAPAADTDRAWPASTHTTQRVLIAARLCLPGLIAAAERLREWHADLTPAGVQVIGLVLTPICPGRVPTVVRRYRATVAELITPIYDIDWHDELATLELHELAEFIPGNRPPSRRRAGLTEAVPAEVARAGADILARLSTERAAAHHATEAQP